MRSNLKPSLGYVLAAALVSLFIAFTASPVLAEGPSSNTVVQVDSSKFPRVVAQFIVTDEKGLPVLGLSARDVILTEDGKPISGHSLSPLVTIDEPMAITLVIDVSLSMAGQPIEDAKNAALGFIDELRANEVASVIAFAGRVLPVQDFTRDKADLRSAIHLLAVGPDTALYDALAGAVRVTAEYPGGRKVILLLTDGEDTASRYTFAESLQIATDAHIPVYTVGLGNQVDRRVLDRIAASTGGKSLYAPTSRDLVESYQAVSAQLRSRYVVTFPSKLKADGLTHILSVRVRSQGKEAEGRAEFIATSIPPAITILSPPDQLVVTRTVSIEARVAAVAPPVTVDFIVDGKTVSTSKTEPFSFRWYTDLATPGRHVLGVTATDSAGNQSSKTASVVVPGVTQNPAVAPPPVQVAAAPPVPRGDFPWNVIVYALGLALVTLLLVTARGRVPPRSGLSGYGQALLSFVGRATCPTCGRLYRLKLGCIHCRDHEQKVIAERLQQIFRQ